MPIYMAGLCQFHCMVLLLVVMSERLPQHVELEALRRILDYPYSGDEVTIQNKRDFIEAFKVKGTITHAAASIGINRKTAHHWVNTDPYFAEALADAHEDCGDVLETSVYERAFKSDLLAMFWLKAYRPRFRDRMTIDVEELREQVRERMQSIKETSNCPRISSESVSKQKDDE